MQDLLIALEIYFFGFIIAMIMAAIIKVLQMVIRRITPAGSVEAPPQETVNE